MPVSAAIHRLPRRRCHRLAQQLDQSSARAGASLQEPPRQEAIGAEAWLLDPEGNRLLLLLLLLP